jgi:hypothetical protein
MADAAGYRHPRPVRRDSAETMNLSHSCGDKRVTKPLIGTVINIPAASAETVAASVTVVGSAFLSNLLAPATAARKRADAGLFCWRHRGVRGE